MERAEYIEILDVLYYRIMRINFSYRFLSAIIHSPSIQADFPNLCQYMITSFATDAYATLYGLFTSGRYSFERIGKNNANLKKCIKEAEVEINQCVPKFRNKRNRIFCHIDTKQDMEAVYNIFNHYYSVNEILCNLHALIMMELDIKGHELTHYTEDMFQKINFELDTFRDLLRNGSLQQFQEWVDSKYGVKINE